jgi:ABC-type glycerol-3-phosphate transport system permease component
MVEKHITDSAASPSGSLQREWQRQLAVQAIRRIIRRILLYLTLVAGAILLSLPLAWLLSSSLKGNAFIFAYPPQWIPNPVAWENFAEVWQIVPFALYLKNTLIITGFSVLGGTLSSAFVAFGFARLRFPGRDILFVILLSTLMIPFHVTLIPTFALYKWLKWLNTFLPFIVPAFLGGGAFNVFLCRQFYMQLPLELDDAARIDGCNSFGIFWRIILPQSKPVLGVIAIFLFMGNWNAFLLPLIYLQSSEKYPLALGINALRGAYHTEWNLLMAASLMVAIPCIVLYFLAQRYFVQGIVFSGVEK